MSKVQGPTCPKCGYPIFGVRDMRCPECGRVLDVRDFDPSGAEHRGEARRYERHAAVGGLIAIVVVLILLAGVVTTVIYFMRFGVVPWILLIVFGALVVLLLGLLGQTGQNILEWFRGRRGGS